MPSSIAQKLKIKEGFTLLSVSAPKDFAKKFGTIACGSNRKRFGKKI